MYSLIFAAQDGTAPTAESPSSHGPMFHDDGHGHDDHHDGKTDSAPHGTAAKSGTAQATQSKRAHGKSDFLGAPGAESTQQVRGGSARL